MAAILITSLVGLQVIVNCMHIFKKLSWKLELEIFETLQTT